MKLIEARKIVAEASPTGRAQIALMKALEREQGWGAQSLTDVMRNPLLRGMHFGKVNKAATVLAKKGLVVFDGVKVSLAEAALDERAVTLSELQWASFDTMQTIGEAYNKAVSFKGLMDQMSAIPPSFRKKYDRNMKVMTKLADAKKDAYQSSEELRRMR